jgi:hypothetical protein
MKEILIPMPHGMNDKAKRRVQERAAEDWGGFTLIPMSGGWKAPDGRIVTEPGDMLTVAADPESSEISPESWAKISAQHLAKETDETEVMYMVRPLEKMGFVTAE